ncbi:MAG: hypothetical protein M5U09_22725 [Gammaproteobacteria bacterium]|nr:hypothetical protein [Gammaproteobacteria bacterium]
MLLNEPSIRAAVEVLRRVQPDVVITHSPADYMLDHEQASAIARTACFGAPIRNVATLVADPAPILDHIPHLYYADPIEGLDPLGNAITPSFWIDISRGHGPQGATAGLPREPARLAAEAPRHG